MPLKYKHEKIKTFRKHGTILSLFDMNIRTDGKHRLAYEFKYKTDQGFYQVLFYGEDFYNSPLHSVDSIETVRALLSFVTLKPGDTDAEYFDNYTSLQKEWINSDQCEQLRTYLAFNNK
jgi:hypothetical protein